MLVREVRGERSGGLMSSIMEVLRLSASAESCGPRRVGYLGSLGVF